MAGLESRDLPLNKDSDGLVTVCWLRLLQFHSVSPWNWIWTAEESNRKRNACRIVDDWWHRRGLVEMIQRKEKVPSDLDPPVFDLHLLLFLYNWKIGQHENLSWCRWKVEEQDFEFQGNRLLIILKSFTQRGVHWLLWRTQSSNQSRPTNLI
jgi:hypothetical protein